MNDLFSTSSFKKVNDVESGMGPGADASKESVNLDTFFAEVENVKDDMRGLEKLYKSLRDTNEECKTAHDAKTVKDLRSRMDSDIGQVLRKAKGVKAKLQALDKSNAENRKIPGCEAGSSADRTRTSVVGALGKKLKDLMDDFQGLRGRMAEEYKETVGRRYQMVTGNTADEETIENLISSGQSESFLQTAIQEQGRGQVMDAISEMQERQDAVKEIEKSLLDLHQVFLDMAALVESQGQQLNTIENQVNHASSFVRKGTEELEVARECQKNSQQWTCYAVILGIVLLVIILFPVIMNLLPMIL